MASVTNSKIVRNGYRIGIEDTTYDDGGRDIAIYDLRDYLVFGAGVTFDPAQDVPNQLRVMLPHSWVVGLRVEDVPCMMAIIAETYDRAIAVAHEHGVYFAGHIRPGGGQQPSWGSTARLVYLAATAHGIDGYQAATHLENTSDGLFLAAMLANSAAKNDASLYEVKTKLLKFACMLALSRTWWADRHTAGDDAYGDTVIIAQTTFGEMAFHVRSDDPLIADTLARAPGAEGRSWCKIPFQARATDVARAYLASRGDQGAS